MKITKIILAMGILICAQNAHAECAAMDIFDITECTAKGGKWCSDGICRVCCSGNESGGGGSTTCSGIYTTDTTQTFSNTYGSGYITRYRYVTSCSCPQL